MQLGVARLCLDCEEVHEEQQCPLCNSEAFVYLTRWVVVPEGRVRARPPAPPEAQAYREGALPDAARVSEGRWLKRSVMGVSALTAAGWLWRWSTNRKKDPPPRS